MLTLFAIPKPFRGHVGVIQRNAIKSWTMLRPACQIILLGDDDGTSEIAKQCGACHVPEVARNEFGTPLLDSVFAAAERVATSDLLCYVNADIILMSDFTAAVTRLAGRMQRFLMVGQRWDIGINRPWDFGQPEWEEHLRSYVRGHGALGGPIGGADYFVFPREFWQTLPPFAIGRFFWDSWLIFRARSLGAPVVDATACVMAIHQAHEYSHARTHNSVWGPETRRNLALADGHEHIFTQDDATHILSQQGLAEETPGRLRSKRTYYFSRILVRFGIERYVAADVRGAWAAWSEAVMRDPSVVNASLVLLMAKSLLGSRILRWSRRIRDRVMLASRGDCT